MRIFRIRYFLSSDHTKQGKSHLYSIFLDFIAPVWYRETNCCEFLSLYVDYLSLCPVTIFITYFSFVPRTRLFQRHCPRLFQGKKITGKLLHIHLRLDFFTFIFSLNPKSDIKGENITTLRIFCRILSWNRVG